MRRLSGVLAALLIVWACALAYAESPIKDPDSFWIEKQDEGSTAAPNSSGGARGGQVVAPAATGLDGAQKAAAPKDVMDKLKVLKKKGLPDGKDESVFAPIQPSGGSGGKGTNVPRGKLPAVAAGKKSDQIARAKTLLDLLSKHGRGGEANEGVSADSIDRARRQVDRATDAAAASGQRSKDEQIADGVMKIKLLMKKGVGGVADEGWSGRSIDRVERQVGHGGAGGVSAVDKTQLRERVLPHIQRSISNPADNDRPCIGSGCRR